VTNQYGNFTWIILSDARVSMDSFVIFDKGLGLCHWIYPDNFD